MADDLREDRVIVEKDRPASPWGWIVALIVIFLLLWLFFGAFGDRSEPGTDTTNDINVEAPEGTNTQ